MVWWLIATNTFFFSGARVSLLAAFTFVFYFFFTPAVILIWREVRDPGHVPLARLRLRSRRRIFPRIPHRATRSKRRPRRRGVLADGHDFVECVEREPLLVGHGDLFAPHGFVHNGHGTFEELLLLALVEVLHGDRATRPAFGYPRVFFLVVCRTVETVARPRPGVAVAQWVGMGSN